MKCFVVTISYCDQTDSEITSAKEHNCILPYPSPAIIYGHPILSSLVYHILSLSVLLTVNLITVHQNYFPDNIIAVCIE